MKKKITVSLLFSVLTVSFCNAQFIHFADPNLEKAIVNSHIKIDLNNDKKIDTAEANKATTVLIGYSNIISLKGLEQFPNLKILDCTHTDLQNVVLEKFPHLEHIVLSSNKLKQLLINDCPKLLSILCDDNSLRSLKLDGFKKLETVWCSYNKLEELVFTNCPSMENIYCSHNFIKGINLTSLINLVDFRCQNNLLSKIDIKHCPRMQMLYCDDNPKLEVLYLKNGLRPGMMAYFMFFANCLKLKDIYVDNEQTEIDEIRDKIKSYKRNDIKVHIQ